MSRRLNWPSFPSRSTAIREIDRLEKCDATWSGTTPGHFRSCDRTLARSSRVRAPRQPCCLHATRTQIDCICRCSLLARCVAEFRWAHGSPTQLRSSTTLAGRRRNCSVCDSPALDPFVRFWDFSSTCHFIATVVFNKSSTRNVYGYFGSCITAGEISASRQSRPDLQSTHQ